MLVDSVLSEIDFVVDPMLVDVDDLESKLVDANVVVTVFVELAELADVIIGDRLDRDNVVWEGVVCITIACSPGHAESFPWILK